jgi:hypothetical protein
MCLCTFKNQLLKQTDTIARYKNLNLKPTILIGQYLQVEDRVVLMNSKEDSLSLLVFFVSVWQYLPHRFCVL